SPADSVVCALSRHSRLLSLHSSAVDIFGGSMGRRVLGGPASGRASAGADRAVVRWLRALGLLVALSALCMAQPAAHDIGCSISSDFNGTSVASGHSNWFSSVVHLDGV